METRWLVIYEDGKEEIRKEEPADEPDYPKPVNLRKTKPQGGWPYSPSGHEWDIEYVPVRQIIKLVETS